jgi:hypothetical protein
MERLQKPLFAMLVLGGLLAVATTEAAEAAMPAQDARAEAASSTEALPPIAARGLDQAFARPGAILAPNRAILLKPVRVSFKQGWERGAAIPTGTRLRSRELHTIKADVAKVVRARVARELQLGGYALAEAPGADVLELDVQVVDLYLNAPDLPTISPVDTYATYFGELTLVGTLRDSSTGDILMHVSDRTVGREFAVARLTTQSDNLHEIGSAAGNWGRALRQHFSLAGQAQGGSNVRP